MDTSKLLWITNHPKSVKGLWPRRIGAEYIEGAPRATAVYSIKELVKLKTVGIYVDMPAYVYYQLPVAKTAADMPKKL